LIAVSVDARDPAAQDARMREALAWSLDRGALYNVVFQKAGEITASLLPNWVSGYSFAFSTSPNLTKARELRSQVERPGELTLGVDSGDPVLQLIADRIVLNARDAGIVVRSVPGASKTTLRLVRIHAEAATPAAVFDEVASQLAPGERATADEVSAVFHQEQELLAKHTIIPLFYMPRSVAVAGRVHELALSPDGMLRVADFWLEDGK
jgi:ABC-type oligopeptide transport system substrate-binding subunit